MPGETILRPDAQGRIDLGSFARHLEERFLGCSISGYAAEITADGAILLRPRVGVDAGDAATLILDDADRDAFLAAVEDPPMLNDALHAAALRHRRNTVRR
ncbi:MAG: hypothetical protein JXP34_00600 [Planctomycetes bacterium]|nr:hypothetical protein [Planctomycetota bacterium]